MKDKVFAQIYSMIRTQSEGFTNAVEVISRAGYDGIELVGEATGGRSVPELKQFLSDMKLKVISFTATKGIENIPFAEAMGLKYLAVGVDNDLVTRDEILGACEEWNRQGAICREHGLKLCLHNHSEEFMDVKGEEGRTRIYDLYLQNTDPELVGFQFDIGWAVRAGADPVAYLSKYAGRFPLIHVKECCEAAATGEGMYHFPKRITDTIQRDAKGVPIFTDEVKAQLYETRSWNRGLGTGLVDWKTVVKAADAQGCEAYINEREYYHYDGSDGTNVCCVKLDYDYLRSL